MKYIVTNVMALTFAVSCENVGLLALLIGGLLPRLIGGAPPEGGPDGTAAAGLGLPPIVTLIAGGLAVAGGGLYGGAWYGAAPPAEG
tara:strand:- start:107 stop:367 length:261 start_codon:yes stop_codon:yes gene_type:complete